MKTREGLGRLAGAAFMLSALAQRPARAASDPVDTDLGPTRPSAVVDVSLILKLKHADALESFVAQTQTPGQPGYHRFLDVKQFAAAYAPSSADIASVRRYLARYGISVSEVYADRLVVKARGTLAAFESAFSFDVHEYARGARRFRRPRHAPRIPALLRDLLIAVAGPSTEPLFAPRLVHALAEPALGGARGVTLPAAGATASGVPGSFTVGDTAAVYGVNPLYDAGFDGSGSRAGIVTLAGFEPSDAFAYWDAVGLATDPHRVEQVHVDGGGLVNDPADPGGPDASVETTLDVEQAGGLAPGARVIVYDAPNTDAGFLDAFYRAASDNTVESLSVSWGSPEIGALEELGGPGMTLPIALHQALLEAAAQGISVFAAAGDNGAYDLNTGFDAPLPNLLAVDAPASDPAITAAGGTTLPYGFSLPGAPGFVVATESVWGWQSLEQYLVANVDPSYAHALFPGGTGGGVSVLWPRPAYQASTPGARTSESAQSVLLPTEAGLVDVYDLPAGFAGRNLPDVSLDADPQTGYLVYWGAGGGMLGGIGGTSVVAPQLSGMNAVVTQAVGSRLGAWNPMLYRFKQSYRAGKHVPLRDVKAGDNWFYAAAPGYEPGAGLGVLHAANFAAAVLRESGL